MNVVVFIRLSKQLIGWVRCDGHLRHKEIDKLAGKLISFRYLLISLCLRWPSHRTQPISCLDDPIKTTTFILTFYSGNDSLSARRKRSNLQQNFSRLLKLRDESDLQILTKVLYHQKPFKIKEWSWQSANSA